MAFAPRHCPGNVGKLCNHLLPVKDNDPHDFSPTVAVSLAMLMIIANIAVIGLMSNGGS